MNGIENLIRNDDWVAARKRILKELKTRPNDHWLLARLSLTYYEERKYDIALKYSTRALAIAPYCPMVLWDHAGTLCMLDREREAMPIYRRLIRRGVDSIANGPCGEGRGQARGLIADCHYRLSLCYDTMNRKADALRELEKHLDMRGPGCYSIYPLDEMLQKRKQTA